MGTRRRLRERLMTRDNGEWLESAGPRTRAIRAGIRRSKARNMRKQKGIVSSPLLE